jgi:hypothetical protein
MRVPRDVSGTHLAGTLCRRWQYTTMHQVGSHIILETSEPFHQRIVVPDHHPLGRRILDLELRGRSELRVNCQIDLTKREYAAA